MTRQSIPYIAYKFGHQPNSSCDKTINEIDICCKHLVDNLPVAIRKSGIFLLTGHLWTFKQPTTSMAKFTAADIRSVYFTPAERKPVTCMY
jgi:hypothetical protein